MMFSESHKIRRFTSHPPSGWSFHTLVTMAGASVAPLFSAEVTEAITTRPIEGVTSAPRV